eukprot:TRINITY_DN4269_c0_g1_i1.p1 TRINITY_DN4269_c0_g1~~TRINITY_DN4269_c0_g1_i1.p1  ORF type:complete len:503 (-),score=135.11 TRINITY_DN4269_c0_g1_i1:777-2285(-)
MNDEQMSHLQRAITAETMCRSMELKMAQRAESFKLERKQLEDASQQLIQQAEERFAREKQLMQDEKQRISQDSAAKIQILRIEKQQLIDQFATEKSELIALRAELQRLRPIIETKERDWIQQDRELEALRARVATCDVEKQSIISESKATLSELRGYLNSLLQENTVLRKEAEFKVKTLAWDKELNDANAQLQQAQAALLLTTRQRDAVLSDHAKMVEKVSALEQQHTNALGRMQSDLSLSEETIFKLKKQCNGLEEFKEHLTATRDNVIAELVTAQATIESLQNSIGKLRVEHAAEMQALRDLHSAHVEQLQNKAQAELDRTIAQGNARVVLLHDELFTLREKHKSELAVKDDERKAELLAMASQHLVDQQALRKAIDVEFRQERERLQAENRLAVQFKQRSEALSQQLRDRGDKLWEMETDMSARDDNIQQYEDELLKLSMAYVQLDQQIRLDSSLSSSDTISVGSVASSRASSRSVTKSSTASPKKKKLVKKASKLALM